jgi:hypothetical protein
VHVKLFEDQCPKTQEGEEDMFHVLYASMFGSLLYEMIYTRPCISHAMGVLIWYMSKNREGSLDNSKEGFYIFAWH